MCGRIDRIKQSFKILRSIYEYMTQMILVVKFTNQSDFFFYLSHSFCKWNVKRNTSKGRPNEAWRVPCHWFHHCSLTNLAKNELPLNYSIMSWMRQSPSSSPAMHVRHVRIEINSTKPYCHVLPHLILFTFYIVFSCWKME